MRSQVARSNPGLLAIKGVGAVVLRPPHPHLARRAPRDWLDLGGGVPGVETCRGSQDLPGAARPLRRPRLHRPSTSQVRQEPHIDHRSDQPRRLASQVLPTRSLPSPPPIRYQT